MTASARWSGNGFRFDLPLRSLTVKADGDRQPDWPKAFTEIRLVYEISGHAAFDEALVRIISG